ncbi:MAG: metallophosphoesterase [Chthoniobacteraceae bacterium]
MQRSRLELSPGLWLDARRAVWIEEHRALLVADTHLGYAWAHRQQGNLLPIAMAEDTLDRLQVLASEYAPREIIILGDVIHGAATAEAVLADLRRLHALDGGFPIRLIAGNHDVQLAAMLERAGLEVAVVREFQLGHDLLLHGDLGDEATATAACRVVSANGGRVILGHEHPAITLSDGVATSVRCPCFLVGDDVLALPAFSPWSAGTNIRHGVFLSPYIRRANLTQNVAIVANRLLPMAMRH